MIQKDGECAMCEMACELTACLLGREEKNVKLMHAFNTHVASDPRTMQVVLPIRDGVSLIMKSGHERA